MANKYKEILIKPIIAENPITLQILGICSALAVTSNLTVTLIMCVALTSVVSLSNLFLYKRYHIKSDKAEAIKNKKFGIPGIIPIKNRTAELGNQASLIPICEPICSDKS